jgi:hypothetical protein
MKREQQMATMVMAEMLRDCGSSRRLLRAMLHAAAQGVIERHLDPNQRLLEGTAR